MLRPSKIRQQWNRIVTNRSLLTYIQTFVGILYGAVTFIVPYCFEDDPDMQKIAGTVATCVVTALLFYINRLIIAPLNQSQFAMAVYKFSKGNPDQLSPSTLRFLENLDDRESRLVQRALGFIFLYSSPLSECDLEFRSRSSRISGHLLWFGNSQCVNGFFDTDGEIATLMEMGILKHSPLRNYFQVPSTQQQPLILYKKDTAIALFPNQPHTFECYISTARAVELMLASGDSLYDQTAEMVIADKMRNIGIAKKGTDLRVVDGIGTRNLTVGTWSDIPPIFPG